MDRRQQLSNVSFGGAWSEQIADDEALADALARLGRAAEETVYEDLRGFADVGEALDLACGCHPKGEMLSAAWDRALNLTNPGLRAQELDRIAKALRAGIGGRVG